MMDPLTLVELVVGALTIAGVVGGILMKAFVKPIDKRVDEVEQNQGDHETRIRIVEKTSTEHSVHIDMLAQSVGQLVTKMDMVLSRLMEKNDKE